jgi:hypothetical protein
MAAPTEGHPAPVPFLPSRRGIVAAALLTISVWAGAALGLVFVVSAMSRVSWLYAIAATTVAALPVAGVQSVRWLRQALRLRASVTDEVIARRYHGRRAGQTSASEPSALRPVGITATEVATRTGELLAALLDVPSVRIFSGIGPISADAVSVSHAVAAGRTLVLVESVAWPAGRYDLDAQRRVVSDGTWIGQSAEPLARTVAAWRAVLPRTHRVSGLIVVHTSGGGAVELAPRRFADVAMVDAAGFRPEIRSALPARPSVSRHSMAALLGAVRS